MQKDISVEFNSNSTIETAVSYLNWQTQYGQGNKGHAPTTLTEARQDGPGGGNLHMQSFGGKLDGSSVINWDGDNAALFLCRKCTGRIL